MLFLFASNVALWTGYGYGVDMTKIVYVDKYKAIVRHSEHFFLFFFTKVYQQSELTDSYKGNLSKCGYYLQYTNKDVQQIKK